MRPSYRRRRRSKFPFLLLILLLAGAGFFAWKFFSSPSASVQVTTIKSAPGADAEVRFVETGVFSSFGNLTSLFESETLRVNMGTVDLEFFDESTLHLEGGTMATLTRVRETQGDNAVDISVEVSGEKWAAKVPRKTNPLSRFEIVENGFSVSTRDAEFAALGGGKIGVFAGSVDITVAGKMENLAVGQQITLDENAISQISAAGSWPQKTMLGGNTLASDPFAEVVPETEGTEPSSETPVSETPVNDFGAVEILSPGKNNERVQTSEKSFLITGKVPVGTQKVIVNNYTLQQFVAGNTEFSYRADIALGTMKVGENSYEVVALGKDAERASATITIVFSEDATTTAPVETETTPVETTTPVPEAPKVETPSEETPPADTGLTIDAPANGAVISDETITISGKAPSNATKIVVNDFTLTLFRPGNATWSYKMKDEFGNRKTGTQSVRVRAYDSAGKLIGETSISITVGDAEKPIYWPEERGDYLPPIEGSEDGSTI